ncbi:MAG: hypothetical protein IJO61_02110 [Oscillospiraceae bacterium]|nr:hypothetical protein [Oscillospiraceae bacterium]
MAKNEISLTSVCASLAYAMGVDAPANAEKASDVLCNYIDEAFGGKKADRVFMYNPDAIAQWLVEKYPELVFFRTEEYFDLKLPLCSVMPSVTPVCFGTMYTGANPSVHGIQKYEKPVIKIDTFFDALIRCGKKPAIIADCECSLGKIYLERDMDYFICANVNEINAVAAEVIRRDEHDFILVYNGNYDSTMHKMGPESPVALGELRANVRTFAMFSEIIEKHWKNHNTLVGFAMDHGCHEIDGGCGSHGLDMDENLNIAHFYKAYPKIG